MKFLVIHHIFFTILVTATQVIGYTGNRTSFDLAEMDSFMLYENLCGLPVVSSIDTSFSHDVVKNSSPQTQDPTFEIQKTIQLILDYIIKFNTHSQFVDHTNIWEIGEDTYLIHLGEPHLYLTKCTLHQALILSNKQIPSTTILTRNLADQN